MGLIFIILNIPVFRPSSLLIKLSDTTYIFTDFTEGEKAIRKLEDRRFFIGIKLYYVFVIFLALLLATVGVA
jgi:hypothetical protein